MPVSIAMIRWGQDTCGSAFSCDVVSAKVPSIKTVAIPAPTAASVKATSTASITTYSTAAVRLAQEGKLQLDVPFHTVIDPWLRAQGKPRVRELWADNAEIEQVTGRQLLQMQGGLADMLNPDKAKLADKSDKKDRGGARRERARQ